MINYQFSLRTLSEYKRASSYQRIGFLHSLTELGTGKSSFSFVTEALRWEDHPVAKWYLLKAVGLLRERAAIELLLDVGRQEDIEVNQTSLHRIAAWSLGQLGPDIMRAVLMRFHTISSEGEYIFLVDALGELRSPLGIATLEQAFVSGSSEVKLWASLSLSKIGLPAVDTLNCLLATAHGMRDRVLLEDALDKLQRTNQARN